MTTLEKRVWIATYSARFAAEINVYKSDRTDGVIQDCAGRAADAAYAAVKGLAAVGITSDALDVRPGAMR